MKHFGYLYNFRLPKNDGHSSLESPFTSTSLEKVGFGWIWTHMDATSPAFHAAFVLDPSCGGGPNVPETFAFPLSEEGHEPALQSFKCGTSWARATKRKDIKDISKESSKDDQIRRSIEFHQITSSLADSTCEVFAALSAEVQRHCCRAQLVINHALRRTIEI